MPCPGDHRPRGGFDPFGQPSGSARWVKEQLPAGAAARHRERSSGRHPRRAATARSRLTRLAGPWRATLRLARSATDAPADSQLARARTVSLSSPHVGGPIGRGLRDAAPMCASSTWAGTLGGSALRCCWSADVADEVTEVVLSCTSRIRVPCTHRPRGTCAARRRHGDPSARSDDHLVVATAHDHLAPRGCRQMSSRLSWTCRGGAEPGSARFADITVSTEPGQAHTVAVFQIEPSVLTKKPVSRAPTAPRTQHIRTRNGAVVGRPDARPRRPTEHRLRIGRGTSSHREDILSVAIIGATGGAVAQRLLHTGEGCAPLVRNPDKGPPASR